MFQVSQSHHELITAVCEPTMTPLILVRAHSGLGNVLVDYINEKESERQGSLVTGHCSKLIVSISRGNNAAYPSCGGNNEMRENGMKKGKIAW